MMLPLVGLDDGCSLMSLMEAITAIVGVFEGYIRFFLVYCRHVCCYCAYLYLRIGQSLFSSDCFGCFVGFCLVAW